jgi:hypothetical protein
VMLQLRERLSVACNMYSSMEFFPFVPKTKIIIITIIIIIKKIFIFL